VDIILKTLRLDQINFPPGSACRNVDQDDVEETDRVAIKASSPILIQLTTAGYEYLAGDPQWLAKLRLGLSESLCTVCTVRPPQELIDLFNEFRRKRANAALEARCIFILKTKHGYKSSKVAHILQVSKQIISDTLAISRLPRSVLNDAISTQVLGKVALRKIAQCRKSPAQKRALYKKEKKLAQSGQKGLRKTRKPKFSDITMCLVRTKKVIDKFVAHAQSTRSKPTRAECKEIVAAHRATAKAIVRLLKKYDASYSRRKGRKP
jgi:transposase